MDDLFLSLLSANLQTAQQRGDQKTLQRLMEIDRRLREIIQESLPPGLQVAQQVLDEPDEAAAQRRLDEAGEALDDDLLNTLLSMGQRLESAGDAEGAARVQRLHRYAVGVSMRRKIAKGASGAAPGDA